MPKNTVEQVPLLQLPLSVLRPVQPVCCNDHEQIERYRQGRESTEPIVVAWMPDRGFFAILDGHHKYVAATLNQLQKISCSVVGLEYYRSVPGFRGLLAEIERRSEEYEMTYLRFFYQEVIPLEFRDKMLPVVIEYLQQKDTYETV